MQAMHSHAAAAVDSSTSTWLTRLLSAPSSFHQMVAQHMVQEMKRALFLFAKLNPGLTYVQGMNELYAPLYYMFRTDPDKDASQHAEADAFYCFVDLISEFRDHFCQQLVSVERSCKAVLPLHAKPHRGYCSLLNSMC